MRILLISQFFAPDITAAAFRLTDFAQLLAKRGHELQVITTHPYKAQVTKVDDSQFEQLGIRVRRCHIKDVVGSGARAYLKHYISFVRGSIRLGMGIWRRGWRPDVIYVSSPPLFVGLTGRTLAMLFRRPWVFEVRDIWPDTAVAAGQLSPNGRAYRIGRRMERYFYRKADHITCVSRPMADYLREESDTSVTVIYNGVPTEDIAPTPRPRPNNATKTLLYAGNLGLLQELDLLIEGFVALRQEHDLSGWQLHLLGAGAQLEALKQQVAELNATDNVIFLPPVSRDDAVRQMEEADLLYLNLKQDPTLERTIPSKVFDYLIAARPIVAGLAGEGQSLLESTEANRVFPPGDLQALKTSLVSAITDLSELETKAHSNRQLVLDNFSREMAVQQLERVFKKLVNH